MNYLIGLYLHDALMRPYGGDFLVVILLYCLARGVLAAPRGYVAGAVLLLAFTIEATHYFHLVRGLGWQHKLWAHLLLGSQFAWADLLAYTAGLAVGLAVERRWYPAP